MEDDLRSALKDPYTKRNCLRRSATDCQPLSASRRFVPRDKWRLEGHICEGFDDKDKDGILTASAALTVIRSALEKQMVACGTFLHSTVFCRNAHPRRLCRYLRRPARPRQRRNPTATTTLVSYCPMNAKSNTSGLSRLANPSNGLQKSTLPAIKTSPTVILDRVLLRGHAMARWNTYWFDQETQASRLWYYAGFSLAWWLSTVDRKCSASSRWCRVCQRVQIEALQEIAPVPFPSIVVLFVILSGFAALLAAFGIWIRGNMIIASVGYSTIYFWSQADSYQHHYLVALLMFICCCVPGRIWQFPSRSDNAPDDTRT